MRRKVGNRQETRKSDWPCSSFLPCWVKVEVQGDRRMMARSRRGTLASWYRQLGSLQKEGASERRIFRQDEEDRERSYGFDPIRS